MEFTRILALRHGETTWNQDKRLQGHLDIPLNPRGYWQAARAADALREEAIAAVYSSDLERAHQTASAIATALAMDVRTHSGLRERHFGDFQGKTWTELELEEPEATLAWRTRVPDFAPGGGGETLLQLRERIESTINEIAARHSGEQIVIVAHGGVLDMLYRLATGLEVQAPRTWLVENAAIHRLLWTPEGLSLVGWADRGHLEETSDDDTST
ncbi:histidine phosphatase family protein [Malikia spinosa]|uniref:Histidine phosphatase family protein n=1 Tax=Malikia spinosa TaxID=86180 RepID=A0A2S9KGC8_9BURK|nr:histidine phosphatase family protein [Malikia spinosa]OGB69533.1 MAG: phosphoglycerate mutase [Burkholderiales bacterium RIFOXYC12_FULL_65_23]PRD69474.1 histidine phosphatase family protein [Malikia spinosa]